RRDSRPLLPAQGPETERGAGEGVWRRKRGCFSRGAVAASLGIGRTSEEAEPAHVAVHADGAFDSLPPQAPGGIVLWARPRGDLRGAGRGAECAKGRRSRLALIRQMTMSTADKDD